MIKKYALITHHDENYQALANYTWEGNKIFYANKHGYGYHAKTTDWVLSSKAGFEKIYLIKKIFEEHPEYEWVWWTGSDTLITNFMIRIEDRIDNNYHFIIATDILGLNADSFLIRNSVEGNNFINELLKLEEQSSKFWDAEQRAISNLLGFPGTGDQNWPRGNEVKVNEKYKNIAKIVPQRFMNGFNYYLYDVYKNVPHRDRMDTDGNWRFGDWLIHWPATDLEFRQELAQFYQQFIIE